MDHYGFLLMNCYPKMEEIDSPEIRVFWLSQAYPNMVKKPRVMPRKSDKFIGAENSLGKIRHLDYVRTVSNIFFVFVLLASQMTMSHLIPTFRNICRSNRWMLFVFYKQKIYIHETRENIGVSNLNGCGWTYSDMPKFVLNAFWSTKTDLRISAIWKKPMMKC